MKRHHISPYIHVQQLLQTPDELQSGQIMSLKCGHYEVFSCTCTLYSLLWIQLTSNIWLT
jgi:hypothetical protein